jgi:N-acetylgalactosamine-N,N'-diacetylbacillosaminyl-diphospho-undecaprenol 4-alpha-N-acetylgalactosaminyltransferase
MPKRILCVINSLAGGGAERVMATFLRHSAAWRDRYALELVLLDDEPAAYAAPDGVPVTCLDAGGSLVRSAWRLRRLVRRRRPDLILSFLNRGNVAAAFARAGAGAALVMSERVDTAAHLPRGPGGQASRAMVRLTYPRADRIIAVSQGVADGLARDFGVSPRRIAILSNPVDGAAIRARAAEPGTDPPRGSYVVAMGRLVPNKNFALLVEAFARSGFDGRLLILGEGPARPALEQRIAALGLVERVSLPGFAANPFPLIAGAHCYVLPSNAEGFPNGLVEAMALGVPVIATDCPSGPSEILAERPRGGCAGVEAAAHGVLVRCDAPDDMAEALRLYETPATRDHDARAARDRADDFSVDASVAHYWGVIEDALAGGAARRVEEQAACGPALS